jgi:hypothetical protein
MVLRPLGHRRHRGADADPALEALAAADWEILGIAGEEIEEATRLLVHAHQRAHAQRVSFEFGNGFGRLVGAARRNA